VLTSAESALPPGPPSPRHLWEELLYLRDLKRDLIGTIGQRFATYGDVYYGRVRGQGAFSAMDPEFLHAVLVSEAQSFRRRTIDLEFLGNSVLTSDGEEWRSKRRRLQPGFRQESTRGYATLIREEVERLLARQRPGSLLELHSSMRDVTLRVVCRALFGQEFSGDADALGRATRILQEAVLRPKILPAWAPTPANLQHRVMRARVDRQVYRILDRGAAAPGSLLATLRAQLDAGESGGAGTDARRQELRDEVVTLLLAGHETTALALTWAFYLVALHPDIDQQLAEEIARVCSGQAPNAEHIPGLELTQRVLDETVRLYPPVYVIPRVCTRSVRVAGYAIEPGDEVWLWVYFMQRDARWFPLPERFDPARFAPGAETSRQPRAYLPFGAGLRSCIGRGFATLEAVLVLASVLQRFRLELSDHRPVFARPRITLGPARPIRVRLQPRG
jgi:cytochrome P450